MNTYSQEWVNELNNIVPNMVVLLHKPYKGFKVGQIVSFTFDDTIGQIKGFCYCNTTNTVNAILGRTLNDFICMSLDNLKTATDKEIKTFNIFAGIEGTTKARNYLLIS